MKECPECGSGITEQYARDAAEYDCGTAVAGDIMSVSKRCVENQLAQARREITSLRSKLPLTKDGVRVGHGEKVYFPQKPIYGFAPEDGTVAFVVDMEMARGAISESYKDKDLALKEMKEKDK